MGDSKPEKEQGCKILNWIHLDQVMEFRWAVVYMIKNFQPISIIVKK
jgi:hypothetical protein